MRPHPQPVDTPNMALQPSRSTPTGDLARVHSWRLLQDSFPNGALFNSLPFGVLNASTPNRIKDLLVGSYIYRCSLGASGAITAGGPRGGRLTTKC